MSDNVLYSDKTIEDFVSEYTVSDVLWMFLSGVKNPWYPLINPTQYKQALSEFIKYGTFIKFPIEKIMDWFHIIVRNTCILSSMTTLAGHDYYFPTEDIKEIIFDSEEDFNQFKQELIDDESEMPAEVFGSEYATSDISDEQVCWKKLESMGFYDWCSLPDGSQGLSDYGIEPLFNIMQEFDTVTYAEELIVLVNRCLDVTHQRGDLASAFIEGGSNSLTRISNESKNIFSNKQLNEEIVWAESPYEEELENIILKNPTRKELKDNNMTTCRIVKDWNENYYFADSYEFIHTEIVDELRKQRINAVETNLFYNLYKNTFYVRVDHLEDNEINEYVQDVYQELKNSSYIKKEFGHFNYDITYGEL